MELNAAASAPAQVRVVPMSEEEVRVQVEAEDRVDMLPRLAETIDKMQWDIDFAFVEADGEGEGPTTAEFVLRQKDTASVKVRETPCYITIPPPYKIHHRRVRPPSERDRLRQGARDPLIYHYYYRPPIRSGVLSAPLPLLAQEDP
eukprot:4681589-Pyramimonas_sp.AAC.1